MPGPRPHVCFVAPHAWPVLADDDDARFVGGAELQQVIVARELARRGYPVSMVCLDFGQPDRARVDGIVVHKAFRPDAGVPVLRFLWPRLTSLWSCLRRADADVYYQRGAGMLTGVVAAYCRRHGRKSVFAVAGATKIRFSRDRWMFRYGLEHVDRIVVQNPAQAEAISRETGREPVLIPNLWQATARGSADPPDTVLWVSTIRKVKRPWLYLDLAERFPRARFSMVGGRDLLDSDLYDRMRERAAALPNVEFAGFVPYREVHRWFDRATVFVNTSESEGFPNAFLQAWERGIPTVSFVDSGARIDGEVPGAVVGSLEEMAATVGDWLRDAALRERIGGRCRAYVERHHAVEHVLGIYERLFEELASGGDAELAGRRAGRGAST